MARSNVSPELWQEIVDRDSSRLWETSQERLDGMTFRKWMSRNPVVCLAPSLDPRLSGTCSGPQTVEHVQDLPRMGRRASSDEHHLVAMCAGHNLGVPSRDLRERMREYLQIGPGWTTPGTSRSGRTLT
jgi:hypothetical protein